MIEDGKQVSIELTLELDDGTKAIDKQSLAYQHGRGKKLLPALERALVGLEVGDIKSVTLSPEDGYGTVDPEAFGAVMADGLPEDARKVGTLLTTEHKKQVRVHEVHDHMIVLDLNHPLAGQNLHFDVQILAIG